MSFGTQVDLADLWQRFLDGRFCIENTFTHAERSVAIVRECRNQPLPARVGSILERAIRGESQKRIAIEHGLSASSVAQACAVGLNALGFWGTVSRAPLLLIVAAHALPGSPPFGRLDGVADGPAWAISVDVPGKRLQSVLSHSERNVARLLLEGRCQREIARLRQTSVHTVSNQITSVYRKLGISGRCELRALAAREFVAEASITSPVTASAIFGSSPTNLRTAAPRRGAFDASPAGTVGMGAPDVL
jgi:DNA-binding CsgD family transcriptional regulator